MSKVQWIKISHEYEFRGESRDFDGSIVWSTRELSHRHRFPVSASVCDGSGGQVAGRSLSGQVLAIKRPARVEVNTVNVLWMRRVSNRSHGIAALLRKTRCRRLECEGPHRRLVRTRAAVERVNEVPLVAAGTELWFGVGQWLVEQTDCVVWRRRVAACLSWNHLWRRIYLDSMNVYVF